VCVLSAAGVLQEGILHVLYPRYTGSVLVQFETVQLSGTRQKAKHFGRTQVLSRQEKGKGKKRGGKEGDSRFIFISHGVSVVETTQRERQRDQPRWQREARR
jgi:hypothetical protein